MISGGEKKRVNIGSEPLTDLAIVLLDEPTAHLDMESIEALQEALEDFQGTLVVVSHDREFVSGLATRIIEIQPGGGIKDFRGSYDEYLATKA